MQAERSKQKLQPLAQITCAAPDLDNANVGRNTDITEIPYRYFLFYRRLNMLGKYTDNVRLKTALIHNITKYVTVNDVANILLACGGSPIMADDQDEVEEITSICGGLCINIGTLNHNTIPS